MSTTMTLILDMWSETVGIVFRGAVGTSRPASRSMIISTVGDNL